jgi:hypothetical protein
LKKKHYGSFDFGNRISEEGDLYCSDLVVNTRPDIPLKVSLELSSLGMEKKIKQLK